MARLPRLYKLVRVTRVVKLIKYFGKNDILDFLEFNSGVNRLLTLFVTVMIVVHLMGCLWHYLAKFDDYDNDSWVSRINY